MEYRIIIIIFQQKYDTIIELKNNGENACHWHFVSKLEETKFAKKWISFNSFSGLLLPNEV